MHSVSAVFNYQCLPTHTTTPDRWPIYNQLILIVGNGLIGITRLYNNTRVVMGRTCDWRTDFSIILHENTSVKQIINHEN